MGATARSADDNYNTLTLGDIVALPVADVADHDGCMLALWTPSCMLVDGLMVLNSWGFTFKGTYVWTKMRRDMQQPAIGMGHLFRQSHELALLGVIGKPLRSIESCNASGLIECPLLIARHADLCPRFSMDLSGFPITPKRASSWLCLNKWPMPMAGCCISRRIFVQTYVPLNVKPQLFSTISPSTSMQLGVHSASMHPS
jgi:hypothetical protein